MMQKNRTLIWITVFGIAMAFFESAIVIYLREIYFPEGFSFPLKLLSNKIALTEVIREAMSIIMIISVAMLASRKFAVQFANFLYIFAIWDIFYYVFLKLILGWPESLLTYDILFLIPANWVGPVIAPIIVSFTMILLASLIYFYEKRLKHIRIVRGEWILLFTGAIVLIVAFIWDYTTYISEYYKFHEVIRQMTSPAFKSIALDYIPDYFNWPFFIAGEGIILYTIYKFRRRNHKQLIKN